MGLSDEQLLNMKLKRNSILETAIILFSEKGYEGTTVQNIAKAAGVSFGSVFTYFDNKEHLFHSAVIEPLHTYSQQLLNFNPDAEDFMNELKNMITHHIDVFAGLSNYLNLVVFVIAQNKHHKSTFEELDDFHTKLKDKLIVLVKKGQTLGLLKIQDPAYTAISYTSLLMGLRLNLIDDPQSTLWEDFVPFAIQLFGPERQ